MARKHDTRNRREGGHLAADSGEVSGYWATLATACSLPRHRGRIKARPFCLSARSTHGPDGGMADSLDGARAALLPSDLARRPG